MRKPLIAMFLVICLSGCATVNFSSKYYAPPVDYHNEVTAIHREVTDGLDKSIGLKYYYSIKICSEKETTTPGVPEIQPDHTVLIPEYFIRYVYEFYYLDRKVILTSLLCHELAHHEYNIPYNSPQTHYLTDKKAIDCLLPHTSATSLDFYNTLCIFQYYWSARKGAGGHLFNIGWNAMNIAAIALGGFGSVGDLYATDISTRISLMRRDYPKAKFIFKRSKSNN